jgi:hypothetical protein
MEAFRLDVHQEAADELVCRECHELVPLGTLDPVVLVFEPDAHRVSCDQASIRDGDVMRVAREVRENGIGSAEWLFRINHPFRSMTGCSSASTPSSLGGTSKNRRFPPSDCGDGSAFNEMACSRRTDPPWGLADDANAASWFWSKRQPYTSLLAYACQPQRDLTWRVVITIGERVPWERKRCAPRLACWSWPSSLPGARPAK